MIEKIQKKLKVDEGFLISKKENRFYLSGFTGSNGYLFITKESGYLLLDGKYINQAKNQCKGIEIFNTEKIDPIKGLEVLIKKHGIKILNFESTHVTFDLYERLCNINVKLKGKKNSIEEIRVIKNDKEIEFIEKSCEIAEKALEMGVKNFKIGMTEKELALEIEYNAKKLGADSIDFIIVASGKNGAYPHIRPTDKRILEGEFMTIDFGIIYKGYHSDVTRTFPIGQLCSELKKVYNIVKNAQLMGLLLVKPGISTKEIDLKVREYISEQGYGNYFVHGLGHGIGIDGHEKPILNGKEDMILKEGMTLTIEPGVYIKGLGGVRIEDTVLVTGEGYNALTKLSKEYGEI